MILNAIKQLSVWCRRRISEWTMSMNLSCRCLHSFENLPRLHFKDFYLHEAPSRVKKKSFRLSRNFTIDERRIEWKVGWGSRDNYIISTSSLRRCFIIKMLWRWWTSSGRRRKRRLIRKSKFRSGKIGMIFHLYAPRLRIYRRRTCLPR